MRVRRGAVAGLVAVLVAAVAMAGAVYADGSRHSKRDGKGACDQCGTSHTAQLDEILFHKGHMILRSEQELGLSAEQVERVRAVMTEAKKRAIRDDAEIDVLDVDLMRELHKPTIDVQAARSSLEKKFDVKKSKSVALLQSLADLKATLTPEQYEKLKELYRKAACDK